MCVCESVYIACYVTWPKTQCKVVRVAHLTALDSGSNNNSNNSNNSDRVVGVGGGSVNGIAAKFEVSLRVCMGVWMWVRVCVEVPAEVEVPMTAPLAAAYELAISLLHTKRMPSLSAMAPTARRCSC